MSRVIPLVEGRTRHTGKGAFKSIRKAAKVVLAGVLFKFGGVRDVGFGMMTRVFWPIKRGKGYKNLFFLEKNKKKTQFLFSISQEYYLCKRISVPVWHALDEVENKFYN